jgi:hypothetical protein
MNTIKDDISQNKPDPSQTKVQEDARTTVIDGSEMITPWQGMPVTADPNSNIKSKPDAKTNPGQGFKKISDQPATPSNNSLKINY